MFLLSYQPLLLILIVFPSIAMAREWYIQPATSLRSEYDDNILLREKNNEEAYGFKASLDTKYGVRSEVSDIALTTLVDIYRYWGQKNLDRENLHWDIHSSFNVTARNKFGFDAAYIRDTSITSELELTGLVQTQVGRERMNLSPNWSYLLSETKTLQGSYAHEEVTYEDSSSSSLTSYKTDSASLTYIEQWSPVTQYFVSLTALKYQITDFDNVTNDLSINAGFDHKFSETLSFNFMLGGRWAENKVQQNGVKTKNSSIGPLFSLGLSKQFESGKFDANYSRVVSPSGAGQFLQSDAITANAEYKLTKRFKLMLSGAARFTTAATNNNTNNDRSYYTIEPKLGWEFNRQTSLTGGYRYRMQQYDSRADNAVSNTFFVYLNYQWDKFSTNRF